MRNGLTLSLCLKINARLKLKLGGVQHSRRQPNLVVRFAESFQKFLCPLEALLARTEAFLDNVNLCRVNDLLAGEAHARTSDRLGLQTLSICVTREMCWNVRSWTAYIYWGDFFKKRQTSVVGVIELHCFLQMKRLLLPLRDFQPPVQARQKEPKIFAVLRRNNKKGGFMYINKLTFF